MTREHGGISSDPESEFNANLLVGKEIAALEAMADKYKAKLKVCPTYSLSLFELKTFRAYVEAICCDKPDPDFKVRTIWRLCLTEKERERWEGLPPLKVIKLDSLERKSWVNNSAHCYSALMTGPCKPFKDKHGFSKLFEIEECGWAPSAVDVYEWCETSQLKLCKYMMYKESSYTYDGVQVFVKDANGTPFKLWAKSYGAIVDMHPELQNTFLANQFVKFFCHDGDRFRQRWNLDLIPCQYQTELKYHLRRVECFTFPNLSAVMKESHANYLKCESMHRLGCAVIDCVRDRRETDNEPLCHHLGLCPTQRAGGSCNCALYSGVQLCGCWDTLHVAENQMQMCNYVPTMAICKLLEGHFYYAAFLVAVLSDVFKPHHNPICWRILFQVVRKGGLIDTKEVADEGLNGVSDFVKGVGSLQDEYVQEFSVERLSFPRPCMGCGLMSHTQVRRHGHGDSYQPCCHREYNPSSEGIKECIVETENHKAGTMYCSYCYSHQPHYVGPLKLTPMCCKCNHINNYKPFNPDGKPKALPNCPYFDIRTLNVSKDRCISCALHEDAVHALNLKHYRLTGCGITHFYPDFNPTFPLLSMLPAVASCDEWIDWYKAKREGRYTGMIITPDDDDCIAPKESDKDVWMRNEVSLLPSADIDIITALCLAGEEIGEYYKVRTKYKVHDHHTLYVCGIDHWCHQLPLDTCDTVEVYWMYGTKPGTLIKWDAGFRKSAYFWAAIEEGLYCDVECKINTLGTYGLSGQRFQLPEAGKKHVFKLQAFANAFVNRKYHICIGDGSDKQVIEQQKHMNKLLWMFRKGCLMSYNFHLKLHEVLPHVECFETNASKNQTNHFTQVPFDHWSKGYWKADPEYDLTVLDVCDICLNENIFCICHSDEKEHTKYMNAVELAKLRRAIASLYFVDETYDIYTMVDKRWREVFACMQAMEDGKQPSELQLEATGLKMPTKVFDKDKCAKQKALIWDQTPLFDPGHMEIFDFS